MTFVVNDGGRPRIDARAIVYDAWSVDLGGFTERMMPGSVKLDGDLVALFDHDSSKVLGRVSAGTLETREDPAGVAFTAFPPDTSWAQDLRVSMERGDIRGCSFGMVVERDRWYVGPDGGVCRDVLEASVHELTVTSMPAYPQTSSVARAKAASLRARTLLEKRIGRVLSASNEAALKDALRALEDATGQIEDILGKLETAAADDAGEPRALPAPKKERTVEKRALTEPVDAEPPTIPSLIEELTELFADVVKFYLRAHGAHWNVTGLDFPQYHAFFEAIYDDVYGSVDPLAEILRKLGAPAPFRFAELDAASDLADATVGQDARSLSADLLAANAVVLDALIDSFECASELNQQGIANFLAERIDQHQKWQWQLSAALGTEVADPALDTTEPALDTDAGDEVEDDTQDSEMGTGGAPADRSRDAGGAPAPSRRPIPGFGFINQKGAH